MQYVQEVETDNRTPGTRPSIGDYALLGDGRAVALLSRAGAIDWLCWPRSDSEPLFAAVRRAAGSGSFVVRPLGEFTTTRRYLPGTAVLETTFATETGTVQLREALIMSEAESDSLVPEHELLREITGVEGSVALEISCRPTGSVRWSQRGGLGFTLEANGGSCYLRCGRSDALAISDDGQAVEGVIEMSPRQRVQLSLSYNSDAPASIPMLGDDARRRMNRTQRWWLGWSGAITYVGPNRDIVRRSAITLKLLSFAPSGGIIAAATTSLPLPGLAPTNGRLVAVAGSALTARALRELGLDDDAAAFVRWLLQSTALTHPRYRNRYDVYGREAQTRRRDGYRLDLYGDVVVAAYEHVAAGNTIDAEAARLLRQIGMMVGREWRHPDDGIWELPGPPEHHTLSKGLCWVVLERLVNMRDHFGLPVAGDQLIAERGTLRAEVEARGFNERLNSYTRSFNDDLLDPAAIALALYGYVDAGNLRMRSTVENIARDYAGGPNRQFLQLITDASPDPAGVCDVMTSFWVVESLARAGELEQAEQRFASLLDGANDVGLFARALSPEGTTPLGNGPHRMSHTALINAAIAIQQQRELQTGAT